MYCQGNFTENKLPIWDRYRYDDVEYRRDLKTFLRLRKYSQRKG